MSMRVFVGETEKYRNGMCVCLCKKDRQRKCVYNYVEAVFVWKARDGVFLRADKFLTRGVYSFRWANECEYE